MRVSGVTERHKLGTLAHCSSLARGSLSVLFKQWRQWVRDWKPVVSHNSWHTMLPQCMSRDTLDNLAPCTQWPRLRMTRAGLHDIVTMPHPDVCCVIRSSARLLVSYSRCRVPVQQSTLMSLSWQESLDRDHQSVHERNVNMYEASTDTSRRQILLLSNKNKCFDPHVVMFCWVERSLVAVSRPHLVPSAGHAGSVSAVSLQQPESRELGRGW